MSLYRKARPDEVLTPHVLTSAQVLTVSAEAIAKPVKKDRHKPGYMAEYMRKRRANPAPK